MKTKYNNDIIVVVIIINKNRNKKNKIVLGYCRIIFQNSASIRLCYHDDFCDMRRTAINLVRTCGPTHLSICRYGYKICCETHEKGPYKICGQRRLIWAFVVRLKNQWIQ